jgi:polyisoprenoid-binding protein YceI
VVRRGAESWWHELHRAAAWLLAGAIAGSPLPALAERWHADAATSRIVVNVLKSGLFSGFAHDHHFEVTAWEANAEVPQGAPATATVEVAADAGSLRDRQESLSDKDRQKVEAQAAGQEVLDAQHHPRVEYRSGRFEAAPGASADHVRGTLHGTLTLRGRSAPLDLAIEAQREGGEWRVTGSGRVKQSAFGIKPFSGFGGTVSVKDELRIELAVKLRPGGG